jgi:uroporphyrinogen-III synthase
LDAAIFMSPSSVRFGAGILSGVSPNERPAIACIGATTARAARTLGVEPDVIATTQSVGAIVESLERWFAARERATVLSPH